jgi:hypothetical protein
VTAPYVCEEPRRRSAVLSGSTLNGIDFIEVDSSQTLLLVHCLRPVPGTLSSRNVLIEGGERVTNVQVVTAVPMVNNVLAVTVNAAGDFSTYTLRLVASPANSDPPPGFDPRLSFSDFSFKVDCPNDFDCKPATDCTPPTGPVPHIDYLAKDYASFRRLLFDRVAVTMPAWTEQHAADIGVALLELFAYAGDQLSYYQDAVATEAYLGTARRRVSMRRHARLLDYPMHDGANARVWVCFEIASGVGSIVVPAGTTITTPELSPGSSPALTVDQARANGAIAFETVYPATLTQPRDKIDFYTWSDQVCCLPVGATSATLAGAGLGLKAGDVLVFEEVLGSATGVPEDADPTHCQAVRLDRDPVARIDPLTGASVIDVHWFADDKLTFPLCLESFPKGPASVARANVVLATHGATIVELLGTLDDWRLGQPQLSESPVSQCPWPLPAADPLAIQSAAAALASLPATAAFDDDPSKVLPAVFVDDSAGGQSWTAQRDLLASSSASRDFVLEVENDGSATIRFGDGTLGAPPPSDLPIVASYRVGNGGAGNVGALALTTTWMGAGITRTWNPMPATGGTEPETIDHVRLNAPQAFRVQERAVTADDYATIIGKMPGVSRAVATRRWTGSWYTWFITIDRAGGAPVDEKFEDSVRAYLDRFRLAGYDLEIDGPRYVSLDILFTICVLPGYRRSDVREALLARFVDFFSADNFTFGQPVYLSKIVAAAMAVPGVAWIDTDDTPPKTNRFQRWGAPANGEIAKGMITMGRLEIARVANDPSEPEHGKIDFTMLGGM